MTNYTDKRAREGGYKTNEMLLNIYISTVLNCICIVLYCIVPSRPQIHACKCAPEKGAGRQEKSHVRYKFVYVIELLPGEGGSE